MTYNVWVVGTFLCFILVSNIMRVQNKRDNGLKLFP